MPKKLMHCIDCGRLFKCRASEIKGKSCNCKEGEESGWWEGCDCPICSNKWENNSNDWKTNELAEFKKSNWACHVDEKGRLYKQPFEK